MEEIPIMKKYKVLYYVTTVMSMLVGLWHFFVPVMFQWYDYLPMQYKNLIVGIDYTNYCFSLLLFGSSLLAIIWGKRALGENKEAKELYFFLTIVWIFRACLATFIEPWPLEPVAWAAILQLILSDLLAFLRELKVLSEVFVIDFVSDERDSRRFLHYVYLEEYHLNEYEWNGRAYDMDAGHATGNVYELQK